MHGIFQLEYTIELTEEGRAKQGSSDYHGWNDYQNGNRRRCVFFCKYFPRIRSVGQNSLQGLTQLVMNNDDH